MKKDTGRIFSLIMFIAFLLITVLMLAVTVWIIVDVRFIFPIVFFTVLTVLFALVTVHYFHCCKHLKGEPCTDKRLRRMKSANGVLGVVYYVSAFCFWLAVIGVLLLFGWLAAFHVWFLLLASVTTVFAVFNHLIDKQL